MAVSGGTSRWTRSFAVGSALSMVALQVAFLVDASYRVVAVVGLFGAVLPMVFGMAYLLLPSYVGRTLAAQRLPGVHFVLTYGAVGLLAGHELLVVDAPLAAAGAVLWTAGVAIFAGTLCWTVVPAITSENGSGIRLSGARERQSTRLATMVIPVAVGYLLVGTLAFLSTAVGSRPLLGGGLPAVVHLYGTGFVALLIFALGCRLLTGFFHVTPPASLSWLVLACGAVGPGILATQFWRPPWFLVGAITEFTAMAGYAALVAVVVHRTDSKRVGLYGIALGALAGVVAVGAAVYALGDGSGAAISIHVPVVLDGFLILTVVGYAYQFFPVTNGQFRGATERTARTTTGLIAVGTFGQAIAAGLELRGLRAAAALLVGVGTAVYAYLLIRRFAE
ncbi:hypothetical protein [Halosimplex sp. J119]